MSTHEHRWVYVFDALLHLGDKSKQEAGGSRVEYCTECSSMRVLLSSSRWAYLQGEITKQYLAEYEEEASSAVANPPDEFRISKAIEVRVSKKQQRLGRGISDLMKQATNQSPLLRLVTDNTPKDN